MKKFNDQELTESIRDLRKAATDLDEMVRDENRLGLLETLEVLHFRSIDAIRRLWKLK
jgi:hypothetical protein